MKNKFLKKALAAVMAFTIVGGAAPVNIPGINLLKPALSAEAEDTVTYDYITVLGNPVTSDNASDILGDGVFSFDPETDTITINGDYTNEDYDGLFINMEKACTIVTKKDSTITMPKALFIHCTGDLTIKGRGKLNLNVYEGIEQFSDAPCYLKISYTSLSINSRYIAIWNGNSNGVYRDGTKLIVIGSDVFATRLPIDYQCSPIVGFEELEFKDVASADKYKIDAPNLRNLYKVGNQVTDDINIEAFKYLTGDVNGDGHLSLADPVLACQCIHNRVPADRDADYINLVGDVYNTGDGLTDEDFFVLYGWASASRSYYGAFPVYSFTVNDHGYPENMKKTGEYVYTSKSTVKGASITLDGSIGVNFYVELDENVGKAVLNGPAGNIVYDSNKLANAKVKEGDYEGLYKLSYGVNATQASAKVSLEIYYVIDSEQYIQYKLPLCNSNNELYNDYTCKYSVNDYISDSDKYSSDRKLKNLVLSLDMYCKSAENYFCGTNHDVPYNKTSVEDFDPVTGQYRSLGLNSYFLDLKGYKMALVLNSKTSIRVFYDGSADTADIEEVGLYNDSLNYKKTENGKSYFEIENIRADKLTSAYNLFINEEEEKIAVRVTPESYCYLAINNINDPKLNRLCCALSDYCYYARQYASSNK